MRSILAITLLIILGPAYSVTFDGKTITEVQKKIIKELLVNTSVNYVRVTDLSRTPREQAEVMYVCSERNSCAKYGSAGKKIIDVYKKLKKEGKPKNIVIDKMEEIAINVMEEAKENGQLQHMFDDVIAIDLSKRKVKSKVTIIEHREQFMNNCKKHSRIKRCFGPGNLDPDAFHIEIKK